MVIVQYTYIGKIVFSILNPEMKSCSQYMLSFYIMQCCTEQPFSNNVGTITFLKLVPQGKMSLVNIEKITWQ